MADIFLSYAREDLESAKGIADALIAHGWSVWWDRTIRPGLQFDEVLEVELRDARCVVVLWSAPSVTSRWVKAEASEARDSGTLVPVLLDRDARVPVGFKLLQSADLSDWDGSDTHHGFWQLTMALTTVVQPRPAAPPERARSAGHEKVKCPKCHSVYLDSFIFCPRCGAERLADVSDVDPHLALVTQLLHKALDSQYAVVRPIGRGGSGYVFLATDLTLRREVAVKAYPPELMMGIGRERFIRAARISRAVQHPSIVQTHTAGIAEGIGFLVMQYMSGGSLQARMQSGRPGNAMASVKQLLPIAYALALLHDNDIVHRDVKPSNILFDEHDAVGLADLGLAKMLHDHVQEALTVSGALVGTPTYMSPEQLMSQTPGAANDQFSFGVVLYQVLTGRQPFEGDSHVSLMLQIINDRQPSVATLTPQVPRSISDAVDRMLAKQPEDRFPSMRHAAAVLESSLAGGTSS